jgi:hypothetical protein
MDEITNDWARLTNNAEIVSMVTYKDMTLVATAHNIYVIRNGKLDILKFEDPGEVWVRHGDTPET